MLANRECELRLGLRAEELRGKTAAETHPHPAGLEVLEDDLEVIRHGLPTNVEQLYPGRERASVCHIRRVPIRNAAGQVTGVVMVSRDVTQMKRAEDALRESEERYRTLVETIDDAIHVKDTEGRYVTVNEEFARRLCLTKEEILGKTSIELHGDCDRARWAMQEDRQVLESGMPVEAEHEYPENERSRLRHVRKVPLRNETGEVVGVVTLARDITEQKRAEQALRESESLLSRVATSSRSIIFRCEVWPEVVVSYVSSGAEDIFGYSAEELCSDPDLWKHLMFEEDLARLPALISSESTERTIAMRVRHRNGHEVWLEKQFQPIVDDNGKLMAVEGIVRDVTEHRRLGETLVRAQRLEAAGQIAAQVAHDFNNLLVPIAAYPELIKMRLPEEHPARLYCDSMIEAAQQMAAINDDMLALGRRAHSEKHPVDLNRLVEDALRRMPAAPETLKVETSLASESAPCQRLGRPTAPCAVERDLQCPRGDG